MTLEWIELQGDEKEGNENSFIAFGHTGKDRVLHLRIKALSPKKGVEVLIEWQIEAAYIQGILNKWFPLTQSVKDLAPSPRTETPGEPRK